MSKQLEKIIEDFISTVADGWPDNLDKTMADFADDAEYTMIVPLTQPIKGKANIRAEIQTMVDTYGSNRSEIITIGSSDTSVFTERLDQAQTARGWTQIPVVAVFDFNEDKQIVSWREYLDLSNVVRQQGVSTIIGLPEAVRSVFKQ